MLCCACRGTKERLDSTQVIAQGLIFTIAGYETTSAAISYTVALLSMNAAAEARLLQEIDARAGQVPTLQTMGQWPYAMVRRLRARVLLRGGSRPVSMCA
jgi:cytochrome P450